MYKPSNWALVGRVVSLQHCLCCSLYWYLPNIGAQRCTGPDAMINSIYDRKYYPSDRLFCVSGKSMQCFFQDFCQEGANVTIEELRGGMYYCCIFQGFCHRGNVTAHS